jgi:hypothetical protein
MTVIATDGKTIAADTMMTFGSERQLGQRKLRVVQLDSISHTVLAFGGTAAVADALERWFCGGAKPELAPKLGGDASWQLLAITREGLAFYNDRVPYPCRVMPPFTMGCGGDVALGAMKAGVSPERAVEIAIEVDVNCGGEVQVVDIPEALNRAWVRGNGVVIPPRNIQA